MDSRDGFVTLYARSIPAELKYLVTCYQSDRRLQSFNLAIRMLLETHPDLQKLAADMYNGRNRASYAGSLSQDSGE